MSRLKMISQMHELQSAPISKIRFAACSATIPNAHDIGAWLNAPYEFVHTFGEEHRPIQLSTKVLAYKPSKNDFMFERKLNGYVFNVIRQFYEGRPVLVFCATRSSTQETAKKLCERAETEQRTLHHHPFLYSANRESRQYTIANKVCQVQHDVFCKTFQPDQCIVLMCRPCNGPCVMELHSIMGVLHTAIETLLNVYLTRGRYLLFVRLLL